VATAGGDAGRNRLDHVARAIGGGGPRGWGLVWRRPAFTRRLDPQALWVPASLPF